MTLRAFLLRIALGSLAAAAPAAALTAQDSLTTIRRADAVRAAIERGGRLGVARADTLAAYGALVTARGLINPILTANRTTDIPHYHVELELPIDFRGLRSARIGAATQARRASQLRLEFELASVRLDAETTYTHALAALARSRLAQRNAADADSLRRIAVARRDAGDASDLDVELATVNAGQRANAAANDSLTFLATLLDLQVVMGLSDGALRIALADTLEAPPTDTAFVASDGTLPVAAAEASLASARLQSRVQRRSLWSSPSVIGGIEWGDPDPGARQLLPLFGFVIPVPLLNRNRGAVLQSNAGLERAQAELSLARVESRTRIARAARTRAIALARLARDRSLVVSANRVATMSLTAYREGASTLPNVLEAQRNAREVLGQYVDDLAAVLNAAATLRTLMLTPTASTSSGTTR